MVHINRLTKVNLYLYVFLLLGITACGDYSVNLPNGYTLVSVYSGAILINHPHEGIAVEANIDSYQVIGDLVVGHSTSAELLPEKGFSKPGYFILDTRTRKVLQALDRTTWLSNLAKLGVSEVPVLNKPSRFG